MAEGWTDIEAAMTAAARGDHAAQEWCAGFFFCAAKSGEGCMLERLLLAELYARQAVVGGASSAKLGLAEIEIERAVALWPYEKSQSAALLLSTEALVLLDSLADAGDDQALEMIVALSEKCTPEFWRAISRRPLEVERTA